MSFYNYLMTVIKINYVVLGGASLTTPFYFKYYVNEDIIPETEINHYLTMSNILPGAMSIYMTAYTGMYLHGKKGMFGGLTVLIAPITICAILLFEFINYLPFDISLMMYISLPIMIIASIDYIVSVFRSDIDAKYKYSIFFGSCLLLGLAIIGTIQLILIFILVIYILNRKEPNA